MKPKKEKYFNGKQKLLKGMGGSDIIFSLKVTT